MALRTSLVAQPHLYMGDTQGRPLDAGKVYFGEPNKDPELYPIDVYYDEALTIAAPQPIRTMGGFMNANGQMVEVYAAETTYSVKVLDGYGRQVFYQESMSSDSTSASVSTRLPYINAVDRTQAEKNSDVVSVGDFGYTTQSDIADYLIKAIDSGVTSVLIPSGEHTAILQSDKSEKILTNINKFVCYGFLNFKLDAGLHELTDQVIVKGSTVDKISIRGAEGSDRFINSVVSEAGSAKNYLITYQLSDASGIEVGDYVSIRSSIEGTGDFEYHAGAWRVTAVSGNNITVKNTYLGESLPVSTVTSVRVRHIPTRIEFKACDGFRFEGGVTLREFDDIAIVGDYNITDGSGTHGTHGIVSSAPLVRTGLSTNKTYDTGGFAAIGQNVLISGFGEQGIAVSGRGHMVANFLASCSNRKRGFYAEGGHIRCKHAVANGNGEDGFIADTTGFIQAAWALACGNGLNGFWSTSLSFLNCSNSVALGNNNHGYECRGATRLTGDMAAAKRNKVTGFYATDGGMIDADNAVSENNGKDGYRASCGSVVDCDNSKALNNAEIGYVSEYTSVVRAGGSTATGNTISNYENRDSTLFLSNGDLEVDSIESKRVYSRVYSENKEHYVRTAVTSIGDIIISANQKHLLTLKPAGILHPSDDNSALLGRANNRWATIYAGTGTINTSDERLKTELISTSAAEKRAAIKIKESIGRYQFTDAVDSKGDKARYHFGVGAQTVARILQDEGLDPEQYAFYCYDEWEATEEIEAGSRYGIRYEELAMFMLAAI